MIAPKISFKINVVPLSFGWESSIISCSCLFFCVAALTRIVCHFLYGAVKFSFEHADSIDRVPRHVVG